MQRQIKKEKKEIEDWDILLSKGYNFLNKQAAKNNYFIIIICILFTSSRGANHYKLLVGQSTGIKIFLKKA